jgi:hypothetical protein
VPVAWGIARASDGPNLARQARVALSSSDPTFGVDAQQVVDGNRKNLGFHTTNQGTKSVTLDLLGIKRIRRVIVYNRADCCQERAVPLALEVSTDGKVFRRLAERQATFSIWKPDLDQTEARFVRLVQTGALHFHLSEIEVR